MFKTLCLLTALACLAPNHHVSAATKNVICYWGSWSHYRTGNGQFNALNVDASLCTHFIYTFLGLNDDDGSTKLLDEWLDISLGMLNKTNDLKNSNPNLKTLLAVGGWNEGSSKYSNMAANATKRANFIASSLKWVEDYGFDGFDLDWEYPARRGGVDADKDNFATLLTEMYPVFNNKGLLLTAAVSAVPSQADTSYNVPVLAQNLDFINVMLYDYFGGWDSTTGSNAPFNTSARYTGTTYSDWNVVDCIQGWLDRGATAEKLALGVPFYGRTWTLSDSTNNGVAAAASGAGVAGPYTQTAGFLGYNEIIEKFNAGGWTEGWDSEAQTPYAYNGNQWISYDNPQSIAIKVNFAKSLNIGSIMLWSIETDDFKGLSGTAFPLLKAIRDTIGTDSTSSSDDSSSSSDDSSSSSDNSDSSSSSNDTSSSSDSQSGDSSSSSDSCSSNSSSSDSASSDSASSDSASSDSASSDSASSDSESSDSASSDSATSDSASSDSSSSSSTFTCTAAGYFRCPSDCNKYYVCDDSLILYTMSCASGLYFDTTTNGCNYASSVDCSV